MKCNISKLNALQNLKKKTYHCHCIYTVWSIFSNFGAIYCWSMRSSPKSQNH